MMMSEILATVKRGPYGECVHRGSAVAVDADGRMYGSVGDERCRTFFRSAAKPLQALLTITSGAADKFGLTDQEIAVICGSHFAEEMHRDAVASILAKARVPLSALKSPAVRSIDMKRALEQAREGRELDAIDSNCSGKHSGMLASCAAKGWPLEGYMQPDHPCQKEIVDLIGEVCKVSPASIGLAVDGCGVPVHYMPLSAMALGYARLVNSKGLRDDLRSACERVIRAMAAHPEMIAGTGSFVSELIRETDGGVIGKVGADGVFCFAIPQSGIAAAIKIEDGSSRALPAVVMSALRQLGAFPRGVPDGLVKYVRPELKTASGEKCGEVVTAFQLGTYQNF